MMCSVVQFGVVWCTLQHRVIKTQECLFSLPISLLFFFFLFPLLFLFPYSYSSSFFSFFFFFNSILTPSRTRLTQWGLDLKCFIYAIFDILKWLQREKILKFDNSEIYNRISETDSKIVKIVGEREKKDCERGSEMKEKDVEKETEIESNEDIEYFNFQSKWLSNVRVQCNRIYEDKTLKSENEGGINNVTEIDEVKEVVKEVEEEEADWSEALTGHF